LFQNQAFLLSSATRPVYLVTTSMSKHCVRIAKTKAFDKSLHSCEN